jgi:hypothetical protein
MRGFILFGRVWLRLLSYDRWIALGGLLAGTSGGCTFGWYIYARQSDGKTGFPGPLGAAFLVITGIGILLFIIGILKPRDKEPSSASKLHPTTSGRTRIGYDIADDGEVESHNARIRNQDISFKVRGSGKLRDKGTDIG